MPFASYHAISDGGAPASTVCTGHPISVAMAVA